MRYCVITNKHEHEQDEILPFDKFHAERERVFFEDGHQLGYLLAIVAVSAPWRTVACTWTTNETGTVSV
jgi:hypothetical protein